MYDYQMVFVYPLSMPVDDLSELEEGVLDQLEQSITKAVDDGWEYVSTATFPKLKPDQPPQSEQGVKAFVYRRLRGINAEFTRPAAKALMQPVRNHVLKNEEDPKLTQSNPSLQQKKSTLLTMAMLNAVREHSQIEPDAILPKLTRQGEISQEEHRMLSSTLKRKLTAEEVASITPSGQEKDVFRVSLMPFGDEDDDYTDYIAELAVYLDLDQPFIVQEIAKRRL